MNANVSSTTLVDPITCGIRSTSGLTGLAEILPILEITTARFEALNSEAEALVLQPQERDKLLIEKAQLVVALADDLCPTLRQNSNPAKLAVVNTLEDLKDMAKAALESTHGPSSFALALLLTHKGCKVGEPNDLQKLLLRIKAGISHEIS